MLKIMLREPVGGGLLNDSPSRSILFIEVEGIVDNKLREALVGGKTSADWLVFTMFGHSNRVVVPVNNIAYIMEMT